MVEFDYNIQRNDFPHNQIYGRVSKLFSVKDVDKYGLAVQTIIGGRLRFVVV